MYECVWVQNDGKSTIIIVFYVLSMCSLYAYVLCFFFLKKTQYLLELAMSFRMEHREVWIQGPSVVEFSWE